MMDGDALAEEIRVAMDAASIPTPPILSNFPPPTSDKIKGWANGFVTHITTQGSATTGGVPGPHAVTAINGAGMAATIQALAGYPFISPELLGFCQVIATYIIANAQITYIGPPPPAAPDWFLGGTISNMDGQAMAALVATAIGQAGSSPELDAKCNAIINHMQDNAEVNNGVIL